MGRCVLDKHRWNKNKTSEYTSLFSISNDTGKFSSVYCILYNNNKIGSNECLTTSAASITLSFFSECQREPPNLEVPDVLVGKQTVACVSPHSRPTLNLEISVDNKTINTAINVTTDTSRLMNQKTFAYTTSFPKAWNGKNIKCCQNNDYCDKTCVTKSINLTCK